MKHFIGILVAAWGLTAMAASASELAEALQVIRAVGPEGRGNVAASAAWKKLAAGNGGALLPILEGMDGANDYALNWLRAAADTIASRELKARAQLPLPELGKFQLETRHHPQARRLVFELLARIDLATADKLLAGMLNDPSLEIRHDAVQKVMDQAGQALAASNNAGAILLFQQALSCGRDVKQIDSVAKKLGELGQPVDLTKLFGFLTEWKIIGPFDNTGQKGFEAVYPPEQKIDFAAEYAGKAGKVRWQDYTTKHLYGMVDMNQPYGKLKEVTAYATTDFFSDRAQPVELRLGGKNSWKVWLNGKLLFVPYHGLTALQSGFGGERPKQLWQSGQLRPGTPSPIVLGAKVFVLNDGGILTCGEAATGQRLWQLRLKGPFSATPVAVGHFLYCVSEKGVAQVVDTSKPEGEVVSELDLGETVLSTPAISRGAIYFRSDARLWKIGKSPA